MDFPIRSVASIAHTGTSVGTLIGKPHGNTVFPGNAPKLAHTAEQAAQTPRKQLLTAARIGRVLFTEGLLASESTVRAVVRHARLDVRDPLRHAFVPLVYAPGEDAQVDFFEAEVDDIELGRVKRFFLLVRACFSGRTFAYAAPNQTREALFEGLRRAFDFFGGVFRKLWFDILEMNGESYRLKSAKRRAPARGKEEVAQ